MKLKPTFLLTVVFAALLFACSQNRKEMRSVDESPKTESTPTQAISSSAAVENGKDSIRKFIRTADLKFKVKSVVNATYAIENITNEQGGFVTYTNLSSTTNNKTTIAVSADSSLETIYYTVVNSMTLRVPNTKLDTTLKSIATLIDYLDFRVIRADDVALQLFSNKLTQERVAKNEERLANAIDNRGKKLKETTAAEELLLNKQEQRDQAKISNFSLYDQISYSTVTLNIYQHEAIHREMIYNDKNITAYTPALGSRILEALKAGWEVVESIIVFFAEIWWLLLLVLSVFVLYRKFGNRLKI